MWEDADCTAEWRTDFKKQRAVLREVANFYAESEVGGVPLPELESSAGVDGRETIVIPLTLARAVLWGAELFFNRGARARVKVEKGKPRRDRSHEKLFRTIRFPATATCEVILTEPSAVLPAEDEALGRIPVALTLSTTTATDLTTSS